MSTAMAVSRYPSDEGKGIIRVDGLVRNNAIGDTVDYVRLRNCQYWSLLIDAAVCFGYAIRSSITYFPSFIACEEWLKNI
ncbi:MAG: hypothetical protein WAU25_10655 [Nitrososphaeraceae archaeon]